MAFRREIITVQLDVRTHHSVDLADDGRRGNKKGKKGKKDKGIVVFALFAFFVSPGFHHREA
jgi:hypothetical protein